MSIADKILDADLGVQDVVVTKSLEINGEPTTRVFAVLANGQTVQGDFATESKSGFGGVEFNTKKDIGGLMIAKIKSVLRGTAE